MQNWILKTWLKYIIGKDGNFYPVIYCNQSYRAIYFIYIYIFFPAKCTNVKNKKARGSGACAALLCVREGRIGLFICCSLCNVLFMLNAVIFSLFCSSQLGVRLMVAELARSLTLCVPPECSGHHINFHELETVAVLKMPALLLHIQEVELRSFPLISKWHF